MEYYVGIHAYIYLLFGVLNYYVLSTNIIII